MNYTRTGINALGLIGAVLIAFSASQADTFVKQVTTTDAMKMMGHETPATVDTSQIWISTDRAYQKGGDGKDVLVAADEKKLYLIDHTKKEITSVSMGEGGLDVSSIVANAMKKSQEENGTEMTAEQKAAMDKYTKQFSGMASALASSIKMTVNPTGETKKVGQWNTTKYNVDISMPMGGNAKTEMWVSKEIKVDFDAYRKLMYSTMATMPGFTDIINESKKIDGMPVMSTTDGEMMGAKLHSVTQLLEVKQGDAPANTYKLPDYPVTELNTQAQ